LKSPFFPRLFPIIESASKGSRRPASFLGRILDGEEIVDRTIPFFLFLFLSARGGGGPPPLLVAEENKIALPLVFLLNSGLGKARPIISGQKDPSLFWFLPPGKFESKKAPLWEETPAPPLPPPRGRAFFLLAARTGPIFSKRTKGVVGFPPFNFSLLSVGRRKDLSAPGKRTHISFFEFFPLPRQRKEIAPSLFFSTRFQVG